MMRSTWLFWFLLLILSPAGHAADCSPTPHRSTGTHYKPVTEFNINVSQGIKVKGRILSAADCRPIANAKIAHWQAGKNGFYQDRLRAYLYSDAQGNYQFETEWPNLSPPHIHFKIVADHYQTLETQWIGHKMTKVIEFDMVLESL